MGGFIEILLCLLGIVFFQAAFIGWIVSARTVLKKENEKLRIEAAQQEKNNPTPVV